MWEDATICGVAIVLLCARAALRVAMAARVQEQASSSREAILQAAAMMLMLVLCISLPASEAAGRPRKTSMHFYLHNVMVGPNATTVAITSPPAGNLTYNRFGKAFAMDDLLTRGPLMKSTDVGRAQGFYMWDSLKKQQNNACVLLFFTCTFNDNTRYGGSSLVVQGSVGWDMLYHEVAIVGGTGRFRLAQGFAVVDPVVKSPSYVVLKFNATILH